RGARELGGIDRLRQVPSRRCAPPGPAMSHRPRKVEDDARPHCMGLTIATIVCAYNESRLLRACLYSLRAQTRPPDEIVVINNASTDETGAVARAVPGVRVVDEPQKGLVVARETARRSTRAGVVAFVDA